MCVCVCVCVVCVCVCVCVFTNNFARARRYKKSIFKRSLTSLNIEFFFFLL